MIRWLFKWLFRLVFAAGALVAAAVVIGLCTYNLILRDIIEYDIHAQTGMEAEIRRLHFSLIEPVIEIQDMKIYNSASFGGTPFLNIPELHIEYDRPALLKGRFHCTFVRLDLAELDIVKNQSGRLNIAAPGATPFEAPGNRTPVSRPTPGETGTVSPQSPSGPASPRAEAQPPGHPPAGAGRLAGPFKRATGDEFTGIDTLNISFGREKFIDLQNPGEDCEQTVGLANCIVPHVKSAGDLTGLILLIDLKSDHFFNHITGQKNAGAFKDILQSLGAAF